MKARKLKKNYDKLSDLVRDVETIVNSEPTYTVTLSTSTVSTVVSCSIAGPDSFIGFMPTSLSAAGDLPTLSVTTRGLETFTIEHSSGSSTRTFVYFVWG